MKKFKHWLIRKLGGYVKNEPPKISERNITSAKVYASTSIPMIDFNKMPEPIINMFVENKLAEGLGRELIDKGICKIMRTNEDFADMVIFKTGFTVILPTDEERW